MMNGIRRSAEDLTTVVAVVALAALALAVFAFGRGTTRQSPIETPYRQTGAFTYSAAVANREIYDSGAVATGDPVFSRLSDEVRFAFSYAFVSEAEHRVGGHIGLIVELEEASGWKRAFAQPVTPFTDSKASANGMLSLSALQALAEQYKEQTATPRPQFTVTVRAEVVASGSVAGQPVASTFAPALGFVFDELGLRIPPRNDREGDSLLPVEDGFARVPRTIARTIPLLVIDVDAALARWISLALLGVSLTLGACLAFALSRPQDEPDSIEAAVVRYGRLIVPCRTLPEPAPAQACDLDSLADLVRTAELESTVVLATEARGSHVYIVRGVAGIYRYAQPVASRRLRAVA